ncbi:hypothetical protein HanIR_Chr06g0285361 [Helianthus annuus]|nr:hypothetical protein HanIR_Chr06g0285361 [Helianthus annuus]
MFTEFPSAVSTVKVCLRGVKGKLRSWKNKVFIKLWFAPESNNTFANTLCTRNVPAITSGMSSAS